MNNKKNTILKFLTLISILFIVYGFNYKEVKADTRLTIASTTATQIHFNISYFNENKYLRQNYLYEGYYPDTTTEVCGGANFNWKFNQAGYQYLYFYYPTAYFIPDECFVTYDGNFWYKMTDEDGNIGYIEFTIDNSIITELQRPSEITSFTISTTTNTANITGYWNATTTANITERLTYYYIYGDGEYRERYTELIATTTGEFDFTIDYYPPIIAGATTTMPHVVFAYLEEHDLRNTENCDPFNYTGYCGTINELDSEIILVGEEPYNIAEIKNNLTNFEFCKILNFDLSRCLNSLYEGFIFPTDEQWKTIASEAKENFLDKWPLGYITDFFEQISTTTVGSLTIIDATIPRGLGLGTGHRLTLDLTGVLDPYLYATTSQFFGDNPETDSTETLYDITSSYWKIFVYLGALFYMLARIVGAGLIPSVSSSAMTTETISESKKGRFKTIKTSRSQNYTNRL